MRNKITFIATVVVLLGLLIGAYFYVFFRGSSLTVAPQTSTSTLPVSGSAAGETATTSLVGMVPSSSTQISPRLLEITKGPVAAGVVALDVGTTSASSSPDVEVRFIERQSGNVYAYDEKTGVLTRTSNRTLPGIEVAQWLPSGETAFVSYLSDDLSMVETYALPASNASSTTGFFLPQGLADLAVGPTQVLELASGSDGSVASLVHTDGTGAVNIFTSPLSSLRISFLGKNYLAFTKPAASLPGFVYEVSKAGAFTRLAGPLYGLVALASPSGAWVLVSYTNNGVMGMELINTGTGKATILPVATVADKCVWATDDSAIYCGIPSAAPTTGAYPDDWYQGALSFSDKIWKIDVTGRFAQLVLDPSTTTMGSLDAEALALDPANSTLLFVNKNDGSLWSYEL